MTDREVPRRWRPFLRAAWLLLVALIVGGFVAGVGPYFTALRVPCTGEDCILLALSPEEAQALQALGLSLDFYAGYQVVLDAFISLFLTLPIAGLLFWRKSVTWLGFLLSLTLLFLQTGTSLNVEPLIDLYPILAWPYFLLNVLLQGLFLVLFFVFPDGRFVPRWSRLIVIGYFLGQGVDILLPIEGPRTTTASPAWDVVALSGLLVGVLAQVYRYRRIATPAQRQQTKWVLFGMASLLLGGAAWALLLVFFPPETAAGRVAVMFGLIVVFLLIAVFPISLAFSILRYRLWDIDVVINRTLVYTVLTAVLAAVFYGTVAVLQELFAAVSGQESPVAVVVSTLLIAALFAPLRRRLQDLIDRRFYRRRYDAGKMLARFAASARDEVDLGRIIAELEEVVRETVQPVSVTVWLSKS